jgi:hypothetical protein
LQVDKKDNRGQGFMRKIVAVRTAMVAVGVTALVFAASAPALAKGPKNKPENKGAGSPATPAKLPKPKTPNGAGPKASSPSKDHVNGKGHSGRRGSSRKHPGKGKGRGLAKGHNKNRGPAGSRHKKSRPATKQPRSRPVLIASSATETEVLGIRISRGPAAIFGGDVAAPSLLPRAPGDALPMTGGDIAAMMFIGLMVITIGGLIWRAPSLIDKPRRSRDLSV